MNLRCMLAGFIALALIVSGCVGSGGDATTTTSSTTDSTVVTPSTTTSTTATTTSSTTSSTVSAEYAGDCVQAPKPGCECIQWVCPSTSTVTTSTSTSTTCVTVPYPSYTPRARNVQLTIRGDRFRPDEVTVFLGDTVIANITNEQGLHKIRETYSNKTIILPPGESHELIFYATEEGDYLMTCNPFCKDPLEAVIHVVEPYRRVC